MTSRVFGYSDDIVLVEGECSAQACAPMAQSIVATCSDSTIVSFSYGKCVDGVSAGIWEATLVHAGPHFERIERCLDESADCASDVVHLRAGLAWISLATVVARAQAPKA